jgi:pyruvate-formate lyase
MEFYTVSKEPRPIRLCDRTRRFAAESMKGKYGDEAMKIPSLELAREDLKAVDLYDAAIYKIASEAPVRICEDELVCGSATLGEAIRHKVPVTVGGKLLIDSVSHLTISFDTVLRFGANEYYSRIKKARQENRSERQLRFLKSLENVLDCLKIWHERYLEAAKDKKPEAYEMLKRVPFKAPRSFKEAVQAIWFIFAFCRLCGNWPGIGRLDVLLGDFLKADLNSGAITIDEAREYLASMFIKGCEWIESSGPIGSGDAQHYQNIVLSGIDENGCDVTNEVTYLVLDIVEELGISDFPITVRVNKSTDEKLLEKVAQVMKHGGGIVAVYNEDLILEALEKVGYPKETARKFANDGCWEVQIPGETNFMYMPIDSLQVFSRAVGADGMREIPDCKTVDEVYSLYAAEMEKEVEYQYKTRVFDEIGRQQDDPGSVVSLFEEGCIENARSYGEFGTNYNIRAPHIGGAADTGNSLYAIQKAVFEDKILCFRELIEKVRNNWEGDEALRLYIKNKYTYFGNDFDESDEFTVRVLNGFADAVHSFRKPDCPILFIPGVSTFGRQIEWAPHRCATAFGAKKGEILSGNASATPGTDSAGATALIKSYCKADLSRLTNGTALDVKLFPATVSGEEGTAALCALIRGFVALGGYFMQLDCIDAEVLKEAQRHPENYKTLSVRVSGWNARFVTLDENWQRMIIERTSQNV